MHPSMYNDRNRTQLHHQWQPSQETVVQDHEVILLNEALHDDLTNETIHDSSLIDNNETDVKPVINNIQQSLPTKHQQSQSQLRYMNVCVLNCCSIRNILTYVLDHINEHKSNIVAITESWLSSEDSNNCMVSQECARYIYKLFHVPSPNRRGGGVALLIKHGLNVITQAHSIRQSFVHV